MLGNDSCPSRRPCGIHIRGVRVFSVYLGFYLRGDGGGAAVSTGQGRLRFLKLAIDSSGRDR